MAVVFNKRKLLNLKERLHQYLEDVSFCQNVRIKIDYDKNEQSYYCGDGTTSIEPHFDSMDLYVSLGTHPEFGDAYNETDIVKITMAGFHEVLGHCKQYEAIISKSSGSDDFLFEFADHFVANQIVDEQGRYYFKYSDDVTEIDANCKSIVATVDFLEQALPEVMYGVDWHDTVLAVCNEEYSHDLTQFAPHAPDVTNLGFMETDMKYHMKQCQSGASGETVTHYGYEYAPREVHPAFPGDDLYEYLRTKASDELVDLWRCAENDWDRNIISCAVFAQCEPQLANTLSPDLCDNERFQFGDFNVYDDVLVHQDAVYNRNSQDIMSNGDLRYLLRHALSRGTRFDARCINRGFGDESISIVNDMLRVEPLGVAAKVRPKEFFDIRDDAVCNEVVTLVMSGLVTPGGNLQVWNKVAGCFDTNMGNIEEVHRDDTYSNDMMSLFVDESRVNHVDFELD